ncbi:unnamed protein product [Symbiodinium sp. CCMP2592]|nr:unnamed protein product [Symbiodinium sp. CCMP2592]
MLHGYPLASWTGAVLLDSSHQATDVNAPPDIMSVLRRESLKSWLRHRGTNRIFVCGLAMDLCVLDTAINAVSAGFRHIHMVMDASRAAHLPSMGKFGTGFLTDPASIQQKLKAAGVTVVPTAALLPGFVPYNPVGEKEMLKYGFPKTLGPFALVRCRKLALFVDRAARHKQRVGSRDAEYVERFAEEFMGYWLWVKRDREKFDAQASGNSWDTVGLELNEDGEFFRHYKNGREPDRLEIPVAASQGAMNLLSAALGEWFDIFEQLQREFHLDLARLTQNGAPARAPASRQQVPGLRQVAWRRHGGRGGWFVESEKAETTLPASKLTVVCGISEELSSVSLRDPRSETYEDVGSHVQGLYVKLAGSRACRHFELPEELTEESLAPILFWVDSVPTGAIVLMAAVGLPSDFATVLQILAPLGVPQVPPPKSSKVLACISTCQRPRAVEEAAEEPPCAHHASPDIAYASLMMDESCI